MMSSHVATASQHRLGGGISLARSVCQGMGMGKAIQPSPSPSLAPPKRRAQLRPMSMQAVREGSGVAEEVIPRMVTPPPRVPAPASTLAPWARDRDVTWRPNPLESAEDLSSAASRIQEVITSPTEHCSTADALAYLSHAGVKNVFFSASGVMAAIPAGIDVQKMYRARSATRTQQSIISMFMAELDDIRAGSLKLPWDINVQHRQFDPLFMLDQTRRLLTVAQETISRRERKGQTEVFDTTLEDITAMGSPASPAYPDYYVRNYHFQTDGWLSMRSAKVYDHQCETLFTGSQDAMQRQGLVPIHHFVKEKAAEGVTEGELSLLELGGGTGRVLTFIRDAHPQMRTALLELSPHYLAEARSNIEYWAEFTQGGRTRTVPPTAFLHANAEAIPLADEKLDIVTTTYMFHEIPEEARENVVREAARVLKSGGLFVLVDSAQAGERDFVDDETVSKNFTTLYNEPHYPSYYNEFDPVAMAERNGLVLESRSIRHATKTLSFRKEG